MVQFDGLSLTFFLIFMVHHQKISPSLTELCCLDSRKDHDLFNGMRLDNGYRKTDDFGDLRSQAKIKPPLEAATL